LWVIFALLDPDPDPKPWFFVLLSFYVCCIAADQLQIILKELLEAPHNPADMQIANQVGQNGCVIP
jgi:hypothetical protein